MLVVKEHRKLLLNLSNPAKVTGIVPGAKSVNIKGRPIVSVPHSHDVVRVLRNVGIRAPGPILYYYDWPGRFKPFDHQRDTAEFASLNPRAFILNDMGCVDSETEYLSPEGWVKISAYSGGAVGQYVPETGAVEFVEPQEYVKLPCHKMVRLRTKYGIDQLLSPEHRVLLSDSVGRSEVVSAEELLRRHDQWVSGVNERKSVGRIGYCKAGIPVTFTAPSGAGLPETNAQIRLQIAVIADGHFPSKTNRVVVRLKRPRKIERMRRLLSDAGVEYKESASTAPGFRVFTFYAPVREKSFGPRWWQATRSQLAVVADEVMHWDGSVSDSKPSSRFSTSVRESADFVQYAFVGTGRVARVSLAVRRGSEEFNVSVRQTGGPLQLASLSSDGDRRPVMEVQDSTDGFKYCFVVPSAFLVFRRNGCVFASGNTGKTVSVLWAFDYLRSVGILDWAIVVSPLSTLERVWADEVFKHFPEMSCGVLHGTAERRLRIARDEYDVYVVNHDGIKNKELLHELCTKPGRGLVIVDELGVFRNAQTDRWKALNVLVNGNKKLGYEPKVWAWGLTGTPIPNEPTDAWAQCKLIRPGSVSAYFNAFRDRVMKQLGPYKWVARRDALDTVFEVMQPSIRFSREECIDLPPTTYTDRVVELTREQAVLYKQMLAKFKAEFEGGQITAANEAVKIGKLLQICCIRYDELVLTHRGPIEISKVRHDDLLWDGEAWVTHEGAAYMGRKPVIECGGVLMTRDHLVLSTHGWVTAEEFNNGNAGAGFDWPSVRMPDRYPSGWVECDQDQDGSMVVPLRLRQRGDSAEPVSSRQASSVSEALRLSARQSDARDVEVQTVPDLDKHETSLHGHFGQGLGQVRRAWHHGLRAVARFVRRVLGGHASRVLGGTESRADQQQRRVLAGELSLGVEHGAGEQQANVESDRHPARNHDVVGSRDCSRAEAEHVVGPAVQVRLASGQGAAYPVYDIVNAGPRNRFVVISRTGDLRIVHNCGVAYSDNGDITIPAQPRTDTVLEIIEEANAKVIVFVPLTGALNALAAAIRRRFTVSVVHGGVPKRERDDIFADFQSEHGSRVLVAQPATMAHGLSLTAADTIVWYAPTTSSEIYQQANARIVRPGQKRNTLIVRVQGSDIERRIYDRLEQRGSTQGALLGMFE